MKVAPLYKNGGKDGGVPIHLHFQGWLFLPRRLSPIPFAKNISLTSLFAFMDEKTFQNGAYF